MLCGGAAKSCLPWVLRFEVFHFPIRTYRQFENKVAKGGAAYARNTELPVQVGGTWRIFTRFFKRANWRPIIERRLPTIQQLPKDSAMGASWSTIV